MSDQTSEALKRKPGENMIEGEQAEFAGADLSAEADFTHHLATILNALENNRRITAEVQGAIDYIGFEVTYQDSHPKSLTYKPERSFKLLHPNAVRQNVARKVDFFDQVRQLDTLLADLTKEIRAINDPSRRSPAIVTARAYIDSFRAFLDVAGEMPPEEIPAIIENNLFLQLKKIDWIQVSDRASKLVEAVVRIMRIIGN